MRYDSLLVRDLAAELDARLVGQRLRALDFDRAARRVHIRTESLTLTFDLAPERGAVVRTPASRESGNVLVARGSTLRAVHAPLDERVIELDIAAGAAVDGAARALVIEVVTNRWNAFVLGAERRVMAILRAGASAARGMAPGDPYLAPRLSLRLGAREPISLDEWLRLLLPSPPRERRRRVLEALAYTSPLNVDAILGPARSATEPDALREAWSRYTRIVSNEQRTPCLLDPDGAAQPYPVAVTPDALPQAGLLEAFEEAANRAGQAAPPGPGAVAEEAADRLLGRLRQVDRRIERLRRELDGAPADASSHRRLADLLMSQLHRVQKGDTEIELHDFEGGNVRLPLDPALSPAENAARLYDTARKRDRASITLPRLLERAEHERDGVRALLDRVRAGAATGDELRAVLGEPAQEKRSGAAAAAPLPYRRYRTSSGFEVRVGRGAAANDDLTFHHSSPNDIWLHARDVGGAHVILRWPQRDGNPPARDLEEAAVLAALHSRGRTAGTVPVDWTRRKYVRKPRKSPPGAVTFDRGRTLFVAPDAALEQRLRWDPVDDLLEESGAGDPA